MAKHFVHKTYVQTSSNQANVCVNSKQQFSLKSQNTNIYIVNL